tara:strand:- start:2051 stop:2512 length:462 start_codon:yes stop_codon:yes gene_type:complete
MTFDRMKTGYGCGGMITYELHTLKNETLDKQWSLTAVFEDLELGMHDATRLDETGRYAGIRLIEEKHNEATGKTESKTVFRGGVKFNAAKERSLKEPVRRAERDRPALRTARTAGSGRPSAAPSRGLSSVQILVLSLIAGVAVLYGIYEFMPN